MKDCAPVSDRIERARRFLKEGGWKIAPGREVLEQLLLEWLCGIPEAVFCKVAEGRIVVIAPEPLDSWVIPCLLRVDSAAATSIRECLVPVAYFAAGLDQRQDVRAQVFRVMSYAVGIMSGIEEYQSLQLAEAVFEAERQNPLAANPRPN